MLSVSLNALRGLKSLSMKCVTPEPELGELAPLAALGLKGSRRPACAEPSFRATPRAQAAAGLRAEPRRARVVVVVAAVAVGLVGGGGVGIREAGSEAR